jgi:hypothetical protein
LWIRPNCRKLTLGQPIGSHCSLLVPPFRS